MQREAHARGALGEIRAEQHVAALGYEILSRNAVFPGAEIDLIARDGACIVFIEVKLRTGRRGGAGREAVTKAKQRRISRGALLYMVQNGLMGRQARFDVIEIDGERLTHIRDAFAYQGEPF